MKISASPFAPELRLLSAGQFKMNNPVASPLLSQQVWVLELVTAGQLQVSVHSGKWRTLHVGEGVLYAPGTRYRERVMAEEICRSIALFFELSTLPRLSSWERFEMPYLFVSDQEKLLTPLAERTLQHVGLGAVDDLQATSSFLELMTHLLRAEMQDQVLNVTREYSSADLVARAHRFMRAGLAKTLTMPEIAAEVGLSVSGFAHAYKREAGISPMAALRQMRVEVAKSHLLRNRLKLAQIATETGFADAFHLSRTFKAIVGMSPQQFRRGVPTSPIRQTQHDEDNTSSTFVPEGNIAVKERGKRRCAPS
jgi:AraC-like DNA-binding protein